MVPVIVFVAAASAYLDAYGEEDCPETYKMVSLEAPERYKVRSKPV